MASSGRIRPGSAAIDEAIDELNRPGTDWDKVRGLTRQIVGPRRAAHVTGRGDATATTKVLSPERTAILDVLDQADQIVATMQSDRSQPAAVRARVWELFALVGAAHERRARGGGQQELADVWRRIVTLCVRAAHHERRMDAYAKLVRAVLTTVTTDGKSLIVEIAFTAALECYKILKSQEFLVRRAAPWEHGKVADGRVTKGRSGHTETAVDPGALSRARERGREKALSSRPKLKP